MRLDPTGNDMQSPGRAVLGESSLYARARMQYDATQTLSLSRARHSAFAGSLTARQFKPERLICKGTSACYHQTCFGQVLADINAYLYNADASGIIDGPTYLGYATLIARTDCCPDQVPCP